MNQPKLEKFLVTGAEGMVGRVVPFGLKFGHTELDITDQGQIEKVFEMTLPTGVLHLAALDMRQCEPNSFGAYETNVLGTYHLAKRARRHGIPFVFVSSGAVFNGPIGTRFDENSLPTPLNIYGQTKYLAEILLRHMVDNLLIVRTGWLFGGHGAHHKKFVDTVIELAKKNEPIIARDDQEGSPTYVVDFIAEIMNLILGDRVGVVHIVNDEPATALDIAKEIVLTLGSSSNIHVTNIAGVPAAGPRRSLSEALISRIVILRPWRLALREYMMKQGFITC